MAYEIRAMTIRNNSIPPRLALHRVLEMFENDYVSFQNRQIIHISDPIASFPEVYKNEISSQRLAQDSFHDLSPHIMQTITLVGNSDGFWDEPAPILFITFLQTKDFISNDCSGQPERYDQLVQGIHDYYYSNQTDMRFALYYSLDFCDYVLFVKNSDVTLHNNLVWQLTMGGDPRFQCLRDSYTFYTLSNRILYKEITEGSDTENPQPLMTLAARLSVYSVDALSTFQSELKEKAIAFTTNSIFGRYDIELIFNQLNYHQLCNLIFQLDKAFQENFSDQLYAPFGGYEFLLFSSGQHYEGARKPERDSKFLKALENRLSEQVIIDGRFREYVNEAMQSLRELIYNGFSTEFILGTLPSFCAAIKNLWLPDIHDRVEEYKMNEAAQRIFNALNTLTLCMMHGERRFVQAPAFSASYFDIPAKLFAYYASVIRKTIDCYKLIDNQYRTLSEGDSWDTEDYQFLMVPDFQSGIFVYPIKRNQPPEHGKPEYLCLIYLSEAYFYDPKKAIYLIAQETAHYISNRYRLIRANSIFYTISCLMMLFFRYRDEELKTSEIDNIYDKNTLIERLSEDFANVMFENYKEYSQQETHIKREYYYSSISEYLEDMDFGFALLYNNEIKDSVVKRWIESMGDPSFSEELSVIIANIQEKQLGVSTVFLTNMYKKEDGSEFVIKIVANFIANEMEKFKTDLCEEEWTIYRETCIHIVRSFREAFADYRMTQAIGQNFDVSMYKELLEELVPDDCDFEKPIRHDAVLRTARRTDDLLFGNRTTNGLIENAQYLAIRGIESYLSQCSNAAKLPRERTLDEAIKVFSKESAPEKQYMYILKELDNYMEFLIGTV